jgi:hypothetical protein
MMKTQFRVVHAAGDSITLEPVIQGQLKFRGVGRRAVDQFKVGEICEAPIQLPDILPEGIMQHHCDDEANSRSALGVRLAPETTSGDFAAASDLWKKADALRYWGGRLNPIIKIHGFTFEDTAGELEAISKRIGNGYTLSSQKLLIAKVVELLNSVQERTAWLFGSGNGPNFLQMANELRMYTREAPQSPSL